MANTHICVSYLNKYAVHTSRSGYTHRSFLPPSCMECLSSRTFEIMERWTKPIFHNQSIDILESDWQHLVECRACAKGNWMVVVKCICWMLWSLNWWSCKWSLIWFFSFFIPTFLFLLSFFVSFRLKKKYILFFWWHFNCCIFIGTSLSSANFGLLKR